MPFGWRWRSRDCLGGWLRWVLVAAGGWSAGFYVPVLVLVACVRRRRQGRRVGAWRRRYIHDERYTVNQRFGELGDVRLNHMWVLGWMSPNNEEEEVPEYLRV